MAKKKTTQGVVLTARQILNGYTTDVDRKFLWNTAPDQIRSVDDKDDEWREWNLDWLEHIGMMQLNGEFKKLSRNYDLANGVIHHSDYLPVEDNEFADMVGIISRYDSNSPFSLKFYPIVPNIINVLMGEYAKRDKRIIVKAVDMFSQQEALQFKMDMILQTLTANNQQKMAEQLASQGIELESEEGMTQMNAAAEMATIEAKFKNYRGIPEEWGQHVINASDGKFRMYEKELIGFRDSLAADRAFWHIEIRDEDLYPEIWNPLYTFYHKSPDVEYISEGNYAGQIKLMSIPDIIDIYGSKMNEKQFENLKRAQFHALKIGNVVDDAIKGDYTQYWDSSQPYDKQQPNSVHYEQYMGMKAIKDQVENIDWRQIRNMSNNTDETLIRVTRAYWKSQRKIGHLFWIKDDGTPIQQIVDENYEVTHKPVYDKSIVKKESKDNLLYGEHIDWIWINEVWGGTKIGPNSISYYKSRGYDFEPIYLDIAPLPFQFKGTNSLYGCKLPVEGKIFSERNSTSSGLVDKLYPNQIGYNIVNNQVMDFLADEIGKVILIDQNMIPRNSLEGSWGKHNYPKFYQVMKDSQIALVDTSIQNTETPGTGFSHFQQVDLSKTDQIMARLQLASWFKNEAYALVGVTPQRLGDITSSESATGVQQAVNNSYAQTEMYFEQYMNHLMPRVYQMILEAAQYVTAEQIRTKGTASLTYLNKDEQKEWFALEEDKLLLRDFDIYAMSRANIKESLQQLKQLLQENNTAGGSLYEIAVGLVTDSPSAIISKLKEADDKRQREVEAQRQHEMQIQREQQEFLDEQARKALENENYWKEREIEKDIYLGELKAKQASSISVNPLDNMKLDNERESMLQEQANKQREMDQDERQRLTDAELQREKLATERYKADITLKVAKENKPPKAPAKKSK